jgi:acyl-CoA hydrolase
MTKSTLPPKPVSASAVEEHFYKVFPEDLNASNTLFGGKIMSILDLVASVVAERHANQTCVTAAVSSIHFINSAQQGDVLLCQAAVNRTWRTSMEIGVRILVNNYKLDSSHHLVSAYLTFVAVDDNRNPIPVPPVIPETVAQHCRYEDAENRRLHRQQEVARKAREKKKITMENIRDG